jgi:hypothetical protein
VGTSIPPYRFLPLFPSLFPTAYPLLASPEVVVEEEEEEEEREDD